MSEWCPNCRLDALEDTGVWADSGLETPQIDIQEYRLWHCAMCGLEVKRKPDGSRTKDPRYHKIFGVGDDRT